LRIGSGSGGFVAQIGVIDFTGGLVVHVSAGTGGLVAALVMGRARVTALRISLRSSCRWR